MTKAASPGVGAGATLHPDLLDDSLPTPLYHQIYLLLRERIVSGALPPDALLQGEQEMAKLLGVSRITVKRAMNELAANGLVTRHRGRGTQVVGGAIEPPVIGSFQALMGGLQKMGLETQVELVEVDERPAGKAVAQRLEIDPDALVQRVVRIRRLRGEPFSYLVTHVPIAFARGYAREDLASSSFLALLERAGVKVQEAEQWISAIAASPPPGHRLGRSQRIAAAEDRAPDEGPPAPGRPGHRGLLQARPLPVPRAQPTPLQRRRELAGRELATLVKTPSKDIGLYH